LFHKQKEKTHIRFQDPPDKLRSTEYLKRKWMEKIEGSRIGTHLKVGSGSMCFSHPYIHPS
jgi:hypothetical protein